MRELAGLFAIEVCGYSVMSNHLHLVLRNRPDIAEQWSDDEIALRWRRVFPPRDDTTGEPVEPIEHDLAMLTANPERLLELRKQFSNLSWFMRCLGEKTGCKRCAASAGCSSRRRGDRACLSMPRHAARGAGSRARRRPEWLFCWPSALDEETSTDISMTLSLEELSGRPAGALNPRPGVALTGRIVQLLPSSDHAHATVDSMTSVPERSAASRADVLANCSDR